MSRKIVQGTRGSRSGGPPEQPHASLPPEPEVTNGEGDQGGTPEDVQRRREVASVRRVVAKLALALLALERFVPEDLLEAWGDGVKPAINLLFRFSSEEG